MSFDIIEQFLVLGAVQTARLAMSKYHWGSGTFHNVESEDLVYFFDANGNELGYWTRFDNGVQFISRQWDENIRQRYVFRPLQHRNP